MDRRWDKAGSLAYKKKPKMNEFIHLIIPGEPIAKQRPKFFPIKTKSGFIIHKAVTPKKTVNYETQIKERFAAEFPGFTPLRCPLCLSMWAFFSIPKSASKKKQRLMNDGEIRPTKRPDFDNILKTIDALEGLAFANDSQIVDATVQKFYSDKPRLELWITNWEGPYPFGLVSSE